MKNSDTKGTPRLGLIMTLTCVIIFSLVTFLLTPVYVYVASDIVTSVTVIPDILEILLDLADIAAFAVCYSLIIYSATLRPSSVTYKLCGIYIASSLIRRAASLLITYLYDGYIFSDDIFSVLLYFLLETVQVAAVAMIASSVAKKYYIRSAQIKKAARITGDFLKAENIDFDRVYAYGNPLLNSALKVGIILSAIKIISRVIYDISYGAPSGIAEVLTMTVYYLSDIFVCVIFYALAWLILSKLYANDSSLKDQ